MLPPGCSNDCSSLSNRCDAAGGKSSSVSKATCVKCIYNCSVQRQDAVPKQWNNEGKMITCRLIYGYLAYLHILGRGGVIQSEKGRQRRRQDYLHYCFWWNFNLSWFLMSPFEDLPLQTMHLQPINVAMKIHAPLCFWIQGGGLSLLSDLWESVMMLEWKQILP